VNEESYEADDALRIWLVVDDSIEIDLLNTTGTDIDDLNIEEVWNTVSKKISGYHKLNVKFGLDCNAAFEAVFFDNIRIYDGGSLNLPPTLEEYSTTDMPPMSDSTFSVTYRAYDVDGNIASATLHYSVNAGDTVDIEMISLGYDSLYMAEISDTAYVNEDEVIFWMSATDDSGSVATSDSKGFFAGLTPIINFKLWQDDTELLYEGYYVRTSGVATVGDSVFSNTSMNFYIQDEYPSAVNIYAEGGGTVNIIPGHQYTVTGVITQYGGIVEVMPDHPATDVIDKGEAVMPAPLELDMATLLSLGSELESLLIKILNVDTVASGDNDPWPITNEDNADIMISDDGGVSQLALHIDKDTDIPGRSQPVWPQHITGIFSQYDYSAPYTSGYQIIPRSINDFEAATAIEDIASLIPDKLILYPAYPNPFNPAATIPFNFPVKMISESAKKLTIYNTLGQVVKEYTLSNLKAGLNTVTWNGRSNEGNQVASGLYFAVLQVSNLRQSTKLLLLK
ncbi:MAG TPA: T9SS type A sorting domain-containing protein, partial [Caldithrix sp.]|nr:T9SS type A sorting domain-containing protein [Caldithrix sp.]